MEMLRHRHVTSDNKVVLGPHLLQDLQKQIPPAHRIQELLATVAAAGNEVPISSVMEASQAFRHGRSL
jgi:hypothetical protein